MPPHHSYWLRVLETLSAQLPDITKNSSSPLAAQINWVGMGGIDLPLTILDDTHGERAVQAKVDVHVNLTDAKAKGIHMSRLYLGIQNLNKPLSKSSLHSLTRALIDSQQGLSDRIKLTLRFAWLSQQRALLSAHSGWKSYQVELQALATTSECQVELAFDTLYSSTCPCSAALARALIAENFREQFADQQQVESARIFDWLNEESAINATPHSQRSIANCRLRWHQLPEQLPISSSIATAEQALGTAVQTAVKRSDEQEFARLNAANLMFCEDAARRLHAAFGSQQQISDYLIKVSHMESLHAHDAEASICKGVPGGLQA